MADKKTPEKEAKKSDFERFQYGYLAASLLGKGEDSKYVQGSLELLAGKEGLNLSEDAQGFVQATFASDESIQTATGIYGNQFQDKLKGVSVSEYYSWYNPQLAGLDDADKKRFDSAMDAFKGEKVGEINKKIRLATTKLKAPQGDYSDAEIDEARKTYQKYEKYLAVTQTLDGYKFESLKSNAVDAARKKELKTLASKL